jgi:hypothetical protein
MKEDNLIENESYSLKKNSNQQKNEIQKDFTNFKFLLIKQLYFLDQHPTFFAIIKLIFGILFIVIPTILLICFYYIDNYNKLKYMLLPLFISFSLYGGFILLFFVFRLGDNCETNGIFIFWWERKNLFRLLNNFIISIILIFCLRQIEFFFVNYNLLKEKVSQKNEKQNSIVFDNGSFLLRVLFIFSFWDYKYKKLGYFFFDNTFLKSFRNYIKNIFDILLILCFYFILQIIFYRQKQIILLSILNLLIIYECIYFNTYKISETNNTEGKYFQCKFILKLIEVVPIIFIILILSYFGYKQTIFKLKKGKFFSFSYKIENKIIIIFTVVSFLLIIISYLIIIIVFIAIMFINFNEKLSYKSCKFCWFLLGISFIFLCFGYSFVFGHYFFNLIYQPIAFEFFPYYLIGKEKNYIKLTKRKSKKKRKNKKKEKNNILISN